MNGFDSSLSEIAAAWRAISSYAKNSYPLVFARKKIEASEGPISQAYTMLRGMHFVWVSTIGCVKCTASRGSFYFISVHVRTRVHRNAQTRSRILADGKTVAATKGPQYPESL